MKIKVKIAGMVERKLVNRVLEVEPEKQPISIEELFDYLDRKQELGKKFFKKMLRLPSPPVLLLNGENLDLKEGLKRKLSDGDEISLIMPMAGG